MQSEQINEIAAALAKAQSQIKPPPRNREVTVKTKDGRSYSFAYTTLDELIEAVRAPLTAAGLWFVQTLANGDGKYKLRTMLVHSSGQWIASETPILAGSASNQEFGSALTYMKRYALAAILGVASDEDDDGNAAEGDERTARDRTTASKPKAAPAAKAAPAVEPASGAPSMIPVPLTADGRDTDWLSWGQTFVATLRAASGDAGLVAAWQAANAEPLKNLRINAPKKLADRVDAVLVECLANAPEKKEAA